jgi:hypothetical protein
MTPAAHRQLIRSPLSTWYVDISPKATLVPWQITRMYIVPITPNYLVVAAGKSVIKESVTFHSLYPNAVAHLPTSSPDARRAGCWV